MFSMEGYSMFVEFGWWVRHPCEGFQTGTTPSSMNVNTVSFDITFTALSGVFGGAYEKYIPLSVIKGLGDGFNLKM